MERRLARERKYRRTRKMTAFLFKRRFNRLNLLSQQRIGAEVSSKLGEISLRYTWALFIPVDKWMKDCLYG